VKLRISALCACAALMAAAPAIAVVLSGPPDLTKGERDPLEKRTYNLGATGLRGWIYAKAASDLNAAQGRTSTASRWVEEAIAFIEAAKDQPELRDIAK